MVFHLFREIAGVIITIKTSPKTIEMLKKLASKNQSQGRKYRVPICI
jgi:hypothetical protein